MQRYWWKHFQRTTWPGIFLLTLIFQFLIVVTTAAQVVAVDAPGFTVAALAAFNAELFDQLMPKAPAPTSATEPIRKLRRFTPITRPP